MTRRCYVNAPTTLHDDNETVAIKTCRTRGGTTGRQQREHDRVAHNGGVGANVYNLQDDGQLQLLADEVSFLCEGFWENIESGSILELAWLLSLERNRNLLCKSNHVEACAGASATFKLFWI